MKNKDISEIDNLAEWRDHQLNPGYWVNRIPPWLPRRKTIGFWILSLIDFFLIIPAFLFAVWRYLVESNPSYVPLVWILGIGSVFATVRAYYMKPDLNPPQPQPEVDEQNHQKNKKRKRNLPKRRKDYG